MSHANRKSRSSLQLQTHFSVYEELKLVADQVFEKNRITIGRSRRADLCLDHDAVEAIHAEVHHRKRKVFLTNRFPRNGLRLNGRSVGMVELRPDDVIQIGPYSLQLEIIETETVELGHRPPVDKTPATEPASEALTETDAVTAAPQEPPPAPVIEVAFTEIFEDLPDEDEEETWEAPFSLQSELAQTAGTESHREEAPPRQLQVIRTIDETVVDVCNLNGRERYVIDTAAGRIRLVDANRKGERFVSLLPAFGGYLQAPSGEVTADLGSYKQPEYLKDRKKQLYRMPLPAERAVVVEAQGCSYRIARVDRHSTPDVSLAARPADLTWRHWVFSTGIHVLLLACLALALALKTSAPETPRPHFVEIDPAMLEKLKPPEVPPKPELPEAAKKTEPPKPEPIKPQQPPKKVAKKRPAKKKVARSQPVSRHAKAGGGHGKGNIKNRNIKQAGLLSMLGSPSGSGAASAMAAVSNLDAVALPGASDKNFSVGGLKGALGDGKISVATQGAIMQTKGSQQVLRSAGAGGSGDVAALERGTTGNKKIQAMVTAKMNRKVMVNGGMSREMVKRVIDQHLEEITYCYETALMTDPSILGRIVFEWKILMDGHVGETRIVSSSVNSHALHSCIKTSIKGWQFPEPVGAEVVVSYPFVFDLVSF
jgi:pSer/pThr/pTyr-binding forkhead associated (FHA) protein